jgi:hypothetical protein
MDQGEIFLLIVDEAQRLSFDLLEEIRLLSNIEAGDGNPMTVFLVGQPELSEKLLDPRCLPLIQRIHVRHHIDPLDLVDTGRYITTRLRTAGAEIGRDIFPTATVEAIYRHARGYPRVINVLADNALLLGYSRGCRRIGPEIVSECHRDMNIQALGAGTKTKRHHEAKRDVGTKEGLEDRKPGLFDRLKRLFPGKKRTPKDSDEGYLGNEKSRLFHRSDCRLGKTIGEDHLVRFKDRNSALRQGFRPCKRCGA